MSNDPELGKKIGEHLKGLGVETPMSNAWVEAHLCHPDDLKRSEYAIETVQESHLKTMYALGLDLRDDSLQDTPKRVAKMYCQEIFTGLDYNNFPRCATFSNKMQSNELVVVDRADVLSVCEHHFVPFIGYACIGYIPNKDLLGLSKFHRVVDFFSRRPQVQERLTLQIYHALCFILGTQDVAVTIKAEHMCVKLRGVKQSNSSTITSQMGGRFMEKPALREEFLTLTRR